MIHISLFSGIGGAELAAEWAGWRNLVSCEINPFGRKVLQYYWPEAYHHDDIKTLTYDTIHTELSRRYGEDWRSDDIIITGGFPCQPFSLAGKRKGTEDDRNLWPEMLRIIREVKPRWVVGENVFGFTNWSGGMVFEQSMADLENEGYEVQSYIIPACATNAPHRRDRVWIVAYAKCSPERSHGNSHGIEKKWSAIIQKKDKGWEGSAIFNSGLCDISQPTPNASCLGWEQGAFVGGKVSEETGRPELNQRDNAQRVNTNTSNQGLQGGKESGNAENGKWQNSKKIKRARCDKRNNRNWSNFPTQSPVCDRNDGLPNRLVGITFPKWRNESIKAMGNAWVPQVAFEIFKAINLYESK